MTFYKRIGWTLSLLSLLLCVGCSKDDDRTLDIDPTEEETTAPEIQSMSIDGQSAVIDQSAHTISFILPTRTTLKDLKFSYYPTNLRILQGDVDLSDKSTPLDLSESIVLKVYSGTLCQEYKVSAQTTGLPVVRITTPSGQSITSKTEWMENAILQIEDTDGSINYEGGISIRGRGNSTWNYPKKPYAIKLDEKSKILGMPKHKRWCLLANWKDRTLLRNDAAFWLSKHTGLPYTPDGKFVEVVLNGTHIGNYYLCEQIKIDKNRVNITEMDANETDAEKITGGFLMELDTYFDEVNKFWSPKFALPYQFKEPDEETLSASAKSYFTNYVSSLESILSDAEKIQNHEYEAYFDVDTSIEYMFVFELTNNTDFYSTWPTNGPHSVYFYKDRGGLLCSGPVWDFDYHSFVPAYATYWVGATQTLYYPALLKDEKYRNRMIELWEKDREALKQLPDYIDEMVKKLQLSESVNHTLWPISNSENGDETLTFQEAIDRMKSTYQKRWEWVNKNIYTLGK